MVILSHYVVVVCDHGVKVYFGNSMVVLLRLCGGDILAWCTRIICPLDSGIIGLGILGYCSVTM